MTVEGQVLRMQRLNDDIRRLSSEVNASIDEISRMMANEYMKKKTKELKAQQLSFNSMSNQMATRLPGSQAPPTMAQPTQPPIRSLRGAQESKGDLYNNHPGLHNYGRIDASEKNFESLGQASGERGPSQTYQPL